MDSTVRLDSTRLRALAHPLRMRLLALLRSDGPATASGLAERLAETSGATSYHLRQLARHGFIEEDPERGTGRERWWKAAHEYTSWRHSEVVDSPESQEAADWFLRYAIEQQHRELQAWVTDQRERDPAWADAATVSDYRLELSAAQLRALERDLHAVISRYREAAREEGAEHVRVFLDAFPQQRIAP